MIQTITKNVHCIIFVMNERLFTNELPIFTADLTAKRQAKREHEEQIHRHHCLPVRTRMKIWHIKPCYDITIYLRTEHAINMDFSVKASTRNSPALLHRQQHILLAILHTHNGMVLGKHHAMTRLGRHQRHRRNER